MRKVIVAYDGSPSSMAALTDLQYAGLGEEVDATVLTVADVWLPPDDETTLDLLPEKSPPAVVAARQRAKESLENSLVLTAEGAQRLRHLFPQWIVHTEGHTDSPAWAVVKKAEDMHANLIVLGSHGRTAFQRALLGSVSQTVTANAHCTVRIGRTVHADAAAPVRLMIGYDGSEHAENAVEEVAGRSWPAGTQARIVVAVDDVVATVLPWRIPGYITWSTGAPPDESFQSSSDWVEMSARKAAERLTAAGLAVEVTIQHGSPKDILVDEASAWNADCIFVGARGLSRFDRFMLGSVSNAIATRAHCSVEVVRRT